MPRKKLSLDSSVEEIDLGPGYTVRLRNMCRACFVLGNGVDADTLQLRTVGDLLKVPERDLRKHQLNVGDGTIDRLQAVLKQSGLRLGMEA